MSVENFRHLTNTIFFNTVIMISHHTVIFNTPIQMFYTHLYVIVLTQVELFILSLACITKLENTF